MSRQPQLSAQQEAEAQRIFQILKSTTNDDLLALARLLASKKDRDLLGQTEFEVRDRVHQIGAKAMETALHERKKGGTKAPA
jgi:predicted GNAT family N-acyltransferase